MQKPLYLNSLISFGHLNKQNLQLLVREIISHQAEEKPAFIASSVVSEGEVPPAEGACDKEISDLHSWTEETDARLITLVEWAVRVKRCQRVIVVSNDTDTFALLLYYIPQLLVLGLKKNLAAVWHGEKKSERSLYIRLFHTLDHQCQSV